MSRGVPKELNRKIGRAMHDWGMLAEGDRVLIGVSGGVDSLVTAYILHIWQDKAPIAYYLEAVHVDNGFRREDRQEKAPVQTIRRQMERWSIPFTVVRGLPIDTGERRSCFVCARDRRSRLFDLARERNCSKLALGHHLDDLVETFFLNVLYSGNISTMLPRQDLFDGRLSIIRILSYLEKKEVSVLAAAAGVEPVADCCPLAGDTRRETVRSVLKDMYARIPGAKRSAFSALGNVKTEYLL